MTRDLWQSWAVTAGGLVAGAITLTVLAKIPGGKHAFKFLIADPVARWIDARMEVKIADAITTQTAAVQLATRKHVEEFIAPIATEIRQINHAVNNVEPGVPPIKERVGNLEHGHKVTDAKVDTILGLVESLVQRP